MKLPLLLSAAAALLAVACGAPDPAELATTAEAASADCDHPRGAPLEVMSRNLYLGAALDDVILADTPQKFVGATTEVWLTVVANDFHARALLLAKEIARTRPELVGLQEAYLWRVQSPGDFLAGGDVLATEPAYDYVADLLAALEARGQHYQAVMTLPLFDFEAPTALGIDVRMTDRQVILARKGVKITNPRGAVFTTLLPLSVMGQPIQVQRGWTAVDARVDGKAFTFFDTHLESYHPLVRQAQAGELAAIVAATEGEIVLVGDLNSLPGTEGAAILVGAGLTDVWAELHPDLEGVTCCFAEALADPAWTLDQRIDYVMVRGARPLTMRVVGDAPGAHASGLWPSDHAGVVAGIKLARERPHDGHGRGR
jgi:endonuclease/exonuclease/phosphatase family metal-dependent hydrolase